MDVGLATRRKFLSSSGLLAVGGSLLLGAPLRPEQANSATWPPIPPTVLGLPDQTEAGSVVTAFAVPSIPHHFSQCAPQFRFSWGDGTVDSGPYDLAPHVFAAPGVYPVQLLVTLPDGRTVGATRPITVTRRMTPPLVVTPRIDDLIAKTSLLALDRSIADALAGILVTARQQAVDSDQERTMAGTSTLGLTHLTGVADAIVDIHDLLFGPAEDRPDIRHFVRNETAPLLVSLSNELFLLQSLPGAKVGHWLCLRKCDTAYATIKSWIFGLAIGGAIACALVALIPYIGAYLAIFCAVNVLVGLPLALQTAANWYAACRAKC